MDKQEKESLKAKCHHLTPVVRLGNNGLTQAVHDEIELALNVHELIKIKLNGDKNERKAFAKSIAEIHSAALITEIGTMACFYRQQVDADSE